MNRLQMLSDRLKRIDSLLQPVRERLDLDWTKWNEEHKGGGGGGKGGKADKAARESASATIEPKTPKEAKAQLKFEIGKLTAEFDAAKSEDKFGTQVRITQQIADKIGKVYRAEGGDTPSACASVIGWPGVAAIGKACTAKAEREYGNDPKMLASRQAAAEEVAKEAVINGDAKKVASSMVIAHTYRGLAVKHGGQGAAPKPASEGRFDRRGPAKAGAAPKGRAWTERNNRRK